MTNTPLSALDEPPEGGTIVLEIQTEPVSLQSSRKKKDVITAAIRKALGNPRFLLSGDVAIEVEWLVHEALRYESISTPDVDNILKVILDALCGPEGVMINDCQVQFVSCHWIDWTNFEQQFTISIKYLSDEWIRKDGLRFVKFTKTLCLPLSENVPPDMLLQLIKLIEEGFRLRAELESQGGTYELGMYVMPIQRVFHVGHLKGFKVVDVADVREEAEKKIRRLPSVHDKD